MNLRKLIGTAATVGAAAAVASVSVSAESSGSFNVNVADSTWAVQYWGGEPDASGNSGIAEASSPFVDKDGSYTASVKFDSPVEGMAFIALCTDISSESVDPAMNVSVDSVKVNGTEIEFGINGIPQWKDDAGLMRVNIYNGWSTDAADWATDPAAYSGATEVVVDFTVSGLGGAESETEAETESVTEPVPEETAAPETEPAQTEASEEKTISDPAEEYVPSDDNIVGAPSDKSETNADTGNLPAEMLAAVMLTAAAGIATFRKK